MEFRFVFALAALAVGPAAAEGPDRVSLLLGSHHIAATTEFEEINPGLFLTWEDAFGLGRLSVDANAGIFRNSYGETALAVTGAVPFYERGAVEIAGFLGLAHYPEDGRRLRVSIAGDVIFVAGLQARVGPAFVQVIPSDGQETDAILAAGVTFPLGR